MKSETTLDLLNSIEADLHDALDHLEDKDGMKRLLGECLAKVVKAYDEPPAGRIVSDLNELNAVNVPNLQAALRNAVKRLSLASQEAHRIDVTETVGEIALELGAVMLDVDEVERVVVSLAGKDGAA